MKPKKFIGVSGEVVGDALRYIGSSAGRKLHDDSGIQSVLALEFLFSLQEIRRWDGYRNKQLVFVTYAGTLDAEYFFRDLPASAKDILFAAPKVTTERGIVAQRLEEIRVELRTLKIKIQRCRTGAEAIPLQDQIYDLESEAVTLRKKKHDLEFVNYGRFKLHLLPGKMLTIASQGRSHRSVTIFDLYSFWRKPLFAVVKDYFGVDVRALDRSMVNLPLWQKTTPPAVIEYNDAANEYIARLAHYTADRFEKYGINLKRWYGASAACNHLLVKWDVRREFTKVSEFNTPSRLWRALQQSFYGGRIENFKLGAVGKTYVYDINSAYGFAASQLAQTFDRWRFVSEYDPAEPFSLWFVTFNLPDDCYTGMLPHRLSSGTVQYRKSGRGWHWQPEVAEMVRRYPGQVNVKYGFVMPYRRVTFAPELEKLYAWRLQLQAQADPFEKVVKLLIASVYGKFAQRIGEATFHNSAWAGWITSYTRAMLLRACEGKENSVICFMQDAIHSLEPLPVPLSDQFGEWKLSEWDRGVYLASGVYLLETPAKRKRAMRGFQLVDFDSAIKQLTKSNSMTASREFIVGWRLSRYLTVKYGSNYLRRVSERFRLTPAQARTRSFEHKVMNWATEILESRLNTWDDGRESAMRKPQDFNQLYDMMIDVLKAQRL
jgi:hypothetical protein